uniref:Leucine-rich repeat-containing N-terminal plant-type domain-containing protein n=1 Tax=Musa acuminata subsp. malaccensis TaxID=214687 RepID=A0A804IHW1_MUSAM
MAAAGSGSFQDGRIASKSLMMLVALLLVSCCLGHGFGDEDHVEVEGIGSSCMESERRALLAIKSDMYDPDNWFSSWTGKDCCGWRGVAYDNTTGHVTKLDLRYPYTYTYDMWDVFYDVETIGASKVNPSLQELKHLKYLDLSMNNFSHAPVPTMIASLVHLEYLNLSNAMFDGPIPPQFENLSNLHYLDLHGWYDDLHVDDLDWLSRIPSLKYLDMSYVDLSKATNWFYVINSIPALEVLRLSHADLPYVPSPLPTFNLTTIATLDLSGNSNITSAMLRWLSNATSLENLLLSGCGSLTIESVQVALGALLNLKELDLSGNSLKGEILGILNNVSSRGLKHLDLSSNQLSGDIPPGSLRDLEYLDLSWNFNVIVHILASLGNFTNLRHLGLSDNSISGEIPPTVGDSVRLEFLDLSNNDIIGEIPQSIGNLSNLLELQLSGNKIVGWIPPSIGNLTNLIILDLSYNNIVGSIPETFGALIRMKLLYLDDNQISGEIPSTIGGLQNLQTLILKGNSFTGQIPDTIGRLHSLKFLDISNNNLSGTELPAWLQTQTQLTTLYLCGVGLSGNLPIWFSNFSRGLQSLNMSSNNLRGRLPFAPQLMLDLSNNSFVGPIPPSFTKATSLSLLSLSHNHINDRLPPFFCNMQSLQVLDLSSSHLIGEVPDCQNSFPISLQSLHLNNNNMSGTIPLFLKHCHKLVTLDLGENKLHGRIPTWIGRNLWSLRVLRLRSNVLYGTIPVNIVNLTSLQLLDLSSNNLTGSLPSYLGNFRAMVEIQNDTGSMLHIITYYYEESILMTTKGSTIDYTTILSLPQDQFHTRCAHKSWGFPVVMCLYVHAHRGLLSDPHLRASFLLSARSMATVGSGSFQDRRVASKRLMMLVDLLLVSCCLCYGFGDEDNVEVEGIRSSCMESERRALLAIKSDMYEPDDWFSTWTGKDCCGWRGVACNNITGHVTKLHLRYPYTYHQALETIGGSKVNPSLQELKHLEYLDLIMNNFSGAPVPKMISSLVHLEYLNLSYAMFDGLIPPQFGNLSNLHYLDLHGFLGDLYVDDLDWLSRIPSLKHLDMSLVDLSRASNWFHIVNSISTLEVLHLSTTGLPYAPSPLPPFNLTAIATLDLSQNSNIILTMLRWLSNATSLEYLYLSDCGSLIMEPLQVGLASLSNMKELDLSYNFLRGEILGILSNVSGGLKHLDLSWNYLSGDITQTLRSLRHLEYLTLLGNSNITGHIAYLLGNLTNLRHLGLWDNLISGEIPPTVGNFVQLEYLDLSYNSIAGEIPPSIGNLTGLVILDLSKNFITGQIPSSLGHLTNLESLDLSWNNVVGCIPETFGTLIHMTRLHLSRNQISEQIPESIGDLQNLQFLSLDNNALTGQIPKTIGRLHRLQKLDVSYNNLSGQIRTTMGGLCNLTMLDLSYNNIGGELTNLLDDLSTCSQGASLSSLILEGNNLSGIIPSSMGQLSRLYDLFLTSNSFVLDLSSNDLIGSLPSSLGNFSAMIEIQNDTWSVLHVDNYYYSESILLTTKGEIADYTTVLSLVTFIDLSNNHLSGEIPKELIKLLGLRFLNLSNNHLTGRIPEKIGDMKQLESLDLSVNNLTGEIPSSLSALYFLSHLNLSYNNLSGKIPTSSQLSTFVSWTYLGNKDLCGTPLPDCPVYQTPPDARVKEKNEDDEKLDKLLEYTSIVVGFVVGFWLFTGTLIMKQAIRFAFFRRIDKASDWIYVQFAVKLAKLKSKWQTMT